MSILGFNLVIPIFTRQEPVAADTGWTDPTATGDDYDDWTNPTNAYSQNDEYATIHSGAIYRDQDFYNFGFSIAAGSTIDGITVSIDGYGAVVETGYQASLSWDGGTSYTSTKDSSLWGTSDSDTYFETGGSSDEWGHTWTVSQMGNTYFRLKLTPIGGGMTGCVVYFDHVRVKVEYTPPSNVAPTTTIDAIPDPAISSDVEPFTGGSADSDGTIADVQVTIQYSDEKLFYWSDAKAAWGALTWNTADASDGTFNSDNEDWEYDITDVSHGSGSFTDGVEYTIYAKAQDDDGDWDESPATDSFTYDITGNNAPPDIILIHDDDATLATVFEEWKEGNSSYEAWCIDIDDITSNTTFYVNGTWGDNKATNPYYISQTIDDYSHYNDTAAKVRNYIRYIVDTYGTEYIILFGKDNIPPRNFTYVSFPSYATPCDQLYFGCLAGT